jgi:hypothetical protein
MQVAIRRGEHGHARALGADYLWFTDADTTVKDGRWWRWLTENLDTHRVLIVQGSAVSRDLTGTLVVSTGAFFAAGGFDDGFIGWGSEDLDLRLRLYLGLGLAYTEAPGDLLRAIEHGDELRTRFYQEQDKTASHRRNLVRMAQNALLACGMEPTEDALRELFSKPEIIRLIRAYGGDEEVRGGRP